MTTAASAISDAAISVTPLHVSNRAKPNDAFGLLSIVGWVLGPAPDRATIEVKFAGHTRRFSDADVLGPKSEDGSRLLQFHLVTHLVPDGIQRVETTLITDKGARVDFPPLSLEIRNESALARQVAQDMGEHGTQPIVGRVIDSSMFPYDKGTAKAWFNEEFQDDIPLSLEAARDAEAAQRHLLRWGFCVLHEQLPNELVADFKRELSSAIEKGDLPHTPGSSQRIHGAHQKLPSARKVWLFPPVLEFLENYFKDTPCACQTLTYVNGSEQNAHQDSIHLTPYPNGFMCGVWVALEDVQEDSGELFVYPGSHRSGSLRAGPLGLHKVVNDDYSHYAIFDRAITDLIEAEGYERLVYRPKAGQILVWHENLIHGGSPRVQSDRTRLSVVSHYFAKGSVGYYDSRGEAAALETLDPA